jgi:ribosome-binding factor A
VGEEIRHILAGLLARDEIRDPAVSGVKLVVAEVRMSPDLRNATAYITPFGGATATKELLQGLARAAPWFRAQIARELSLRYAPAIRFEADSAFDQAGRIERLLHDPAVARDLTAPGEDEKDDDG